MSGMHCPHADYLEVGTFKFCARLEANFSSLSVPNWRFPYSKKGGVCSIQRYRLIPDDSVTGGIGERIGTPVITRVLRFDQNDLVPRWLADIVGLTDVFLARGVPFMRSPTTGSPAGRIDLVLADIDSATDWFGLEFQAVYLSGKVCRPTLKCCRARETE